MQDDQLKKIIKYVLIMHKYKKYDKCSRQIATALSRSRRTEQCVRDAYLLLGLLVNGNDRDEKK